MECAFGIIGKDYAILASDMQAGRGIISMKSDENKLKSLGPHLAMAYGGEPGDTNNFADYVDRNLRLYQIRYDNALLPPSASSWIRQTLAASLRSRKPYAVNLLLAGYDTTTDIPHLYWIDYLGTKAVVNYAAHGAGMYVALSTMDKWWFDGMDKADGLGLLNKCIDEVRRRMVLKYEFNCILIDKNGVHPIDLKAENPLAGLEEQQQQAAQPPAAAATVPAAAAA